MYEGMRYLCSDKRIQVVFILLQLYKSGSRVALAPGGNTGIHVKQKALPFQLTRLSAVPDFPRFCCNRTPMMETEGDINFIANPVIHSKL